MIDWWVLVNGSLLRVRRPINMICTCESQSASDDNKAVFSWAILVGFAIASQYHTHVPNRLRSGDLNISELISKSESQFNYLFTLNNVHLSSNSYNFWMQPKKFAEYRARQKRKPLKKFLYFWHYSRYIYQICRVYRWGFSPHILQILLK